MACLSNIRSYFEPSPISPLKVPVGSVPRCSVAVLLRECGGLHQRKHAATSMVTTHSSGIWTIVEMRRDTAMIIQWPKLRLPKH